MKKRILSAYLVRDAGLYPILTITGPRQSGKTTLAKATFPQHTYISLEDLEQRSFAESDPRGFLARLREGAILDEIQRAPTLFSYLQGTVDEDSRPGRFLLTGSHNFLLMREIAQSLAGRSAILHLLPFNRSELEDQRSLAPTSLDTLFANRSSRLSLWPALYQGFYPRIHDRGIPPEVWLADYIQTYIERDVRQLVHLGDLALFGRFLKLCAGRVGQLLNLSSLAGDCGVAVDTARRWISVLQTSFLVFLLPPHHRNFNKRVIKMPKLYFGDTGLACRLLGLTSPSQVEQHPLRGSLFENYIIAEVSKTYWHHRQTPPLFFWRDRTGHEVDLLIEQGETLHAVEIKSGETVSAGLLDGLRWWMKTSGQPASCCALVHGGAERYVREGVSVLPWLAV
jgi:hypothetical protein